MRYFLYSVLAVCLCSVLAYDFSYPKRYNVEVVCENAEAQKYIRIGEKYYFIGIAKTVSWFESVHICRKFGGDLALIETAEEMNAISNYLMKEGYDKNDRLWISGNDLITNQKFMSITNGLPLAFTSWSNHQPDNPGIEQCVHLWLKESAFRMNNWICTHKANYLCQRQNYTRCRDIY
ncbi:C-type lectin 37Db-like [Drosophila montana]|uniref:C-type lectin 37Db-like n=1 Tax=Drosophila montana TaxID=40370 RepID=UPI00313DF5DA